jgi:hypothetical protein
MNVQTDSVYRQTRTTLSRTPYVWSFVHQLCAHPYHSTVDGAPHPMKPGTVYVEITGKSDTRIAQECWSNITRRPGSTTNTKSEFVPMYTVMPVPEGTSIPEHLSLEQLQAKLASGYCANADSLTAGIMPFRPAVKKCSHTIHTALELNTLRNEDCTWVHTKADGSKHMLCHSHLSKLWDGNNA